MNTVIVLGMYEDTATVIIMIINYIAIAQVKLR